MGYILTGGFAAGYRTYILAALGVITAAAGWAVGDQTTAEAIRSVWEILLSGSVAAVRAAV